MPDELLLAVETSVGAGWVALAVRGKLVAARELEPDRRNAAGLFPAIRDLLENQGCKLREVSTYAYSCGPGSFTGLRVAATLGRILQSAAGCQVVAVPTLTVIAQNALEHPQPPQRLGVLRDAGGGRVYAGLFVRQGAFFRADGEPGVFEAHNFVAGLDRGVWLGGDGLKMVASEIAARGLHVLGEQYWQPRVGYLIRLAQEAAGQGRFCRPSEINVLYLRRPECEEVYEQRRAAARQRRGQ